MTQTSVPVEDVSNTNWTPTPVWPQVDQPGGSVESKADDNSVFVVKLGALQWPKDGEQKLTVDLRTLGSSPDPMNVAIRLMQGSDVIAGRNVQNPSSKVTIVLEDAEKQRITDYTDLAVQVAAYDKIVSDCCPDMPDKLCVGLSSGQPGEGCDWMDGVVFPVEYNGTGAWDGSYSDGEHYIHVEVSCGLFDVFFGINCGGVGSYSLPAEKYCDPFYASNIAGAGAPTDCCNNPSTYFDVSVGAGDC